MGGLRDLAWPYNRAPRSVEEKKRYQLAAAIDRALSSPPSEEPTTALTGEALSEEYIERLWNATPSVHAFAHALVASRLRSRAPQAIEPPPMTAKDMNRAIGGDFEAVPSAVKQALRGVALWIARHEHLWSAARTQPAKEGT